MNEPIADITGTKGEEATGKKAELYRQLDAAYVPVSMNPGEACAGCRWFETYGRYGEGNQDSCHLVQSWPAAIEPTGWCNLYEVAPTYEPEPMPVVIVQAEAALSDDPTILQKALKTLMNLIGRDEDTGVGFKVIGDNEWLAVWSNNFKDRENELFDHQAQDEYIRQLKAGEVPMPSLEYWHIPHSSHGVATHVGRAGHYMWAKGVFSDDDLGREFKALYRGLKSSWGMSHGYAYPRHMLVDGVYKAFVTNEITTLPLWAAANTDTWFSSEGVKTVNVTKEQREELEKAAGKAGTRLADMLDQRGREQREAGIDFKNVKPLEDVEARKQIGEVGDLQTAMGEAIKAMAGSVKSMADAQTATDTKTNDRFTGIEADLKDVKDFLKLAPRATKSNSTVVDGEDPQVKFLQDKNKTTGAKSIIEQIAAGQLPNLNSEDPAE